MRGFIGLVVLSLGMSTSVHAQFEVFEWSFENTCGHGELIDARMSVTGCNGDGPGLNAFFRTQAPYAGTLFTRVDFFNSDVFWGLDWVAWELDGASDILQHNYESWIGSLAFDVAAGQSVGLGIASFDAQFGPGIGRYTGFQYFPAGATLRHEYSVPDAGFGSQVVTIGDVNADGVPDHAVGAPLDDAGAGRVQVLSGADGQLLFEATGSAAGDAFGTALDAAGDLNADGTPDLIVGAPNESTSGLMAGAARVLSGVDGAELALITGDAPNDRLGQSVAGLGDADGDGVPDFAVGSPLNDAAGNKAGLVRVYSGADGSVLLELTGAQPRDELGTLLARVGDADGDGLADLLLGTPKANGDGVRRGSVRLVSVASATTLHQWGGLADDEELGSSVAGPGDLDGDGLADVLFSSPNATNDQARAYASSSGELLHAWDLVDWVDRGAHGGPVNVTPGTHFARRVASAGDLDDDGVPDVFVRGTQREYLNQSVLGAHVWVFAFSGRDGSLLSVYPGERGDAQFAASFASAGDLDGDGRDDVLIGHPGAAPELDALITITSTVVWADLGFALPGVQGAPRLVGGGLLAPDTPVTLALENAAPNAASFLVLGLAAIEQPFSGGVLVPAFVPPTGLIKALGTDGAGAWKLATAWPPGVPSGTSIWLQAWTQDAAAPLGRSASNALRATLP